MTNLPDGYLWDLDFRLGAESSQLTKKLWPIYLVEKSDIPEPALSFKITREELKRRFPAWGIRREGKLVAYAHAALIEADPASGKLPDQGWQFAIENSGAAHSTNTMCLMAANVDTEFRGHGLSRALLERAKDAAILLGLQYLVGPVRPTSKSEFPKLSMEEYLREKSDPWVKLHQSCGGEFLNICNRSVVVKASLPKWRAWTNIPLNREGPVQIPRGLAPLQVNLRENTGEYCEPNVWVRYRLS